MTINTQADLNSIAGTPEYERFMASLRGSLFNVYKENGKWYADESNDVIERFGLTRADFDPIEPPVLPVNETAEKIAADKQAVRIAEIKKAAGDLILSRYPIYKQSNMHATIAELIDKKISSTLTTSEQATFDKIKSVWVWVQAVRAKSDEAEADGSQANDIVWPV